jgi:hypothetical protein
MLEQRHESSGGYKDSQESKAGTERSKYFLRCDFWRHF